MSVEFLANLATISGVCIAVVNIIVEVLKAFLLKKENSRPFAVFVVSEIVTFIVMYAYLTLEGISVTPILIAGAVMGGFFVAYGAMFGYDKLYGTLFERLKELKGGR